MKDYYNEYDKKTAAWLRELIKQGHLPEGDVDERSIEDVVPRDLIGYRRHHFFAGIGGWAYALALAGWPDDLPVWTGSCPCQPFSSAGKGAAFADERHLWTAWQHLIAQCRPSIIVGEQVASKATNVWADLVHADLEGMDYAFGCIPFPAASIEAPHIRDRNYWVAYANSSRLKGCWGPGEKPLSEGRDGANRYFGADRMGGRITDRQGRTRPIEPGLVPLAHGLPARVGRLCGYGNAIVPQQAAEFLISVMQVIDDEVR